MISKKGKVKGCHLTGSVEEISIEDPFGMFAILEEDFDEPLVGEIMPYPCYTMDDDFNE